MYGSPDRRSVIERKVDTMLSHNDAGRYSMNHMSARTSMPARAGLNTARALTSPPGQRPGKRNSRWMLPLLLLAGALVISIVLTASDLRRANTTLAVQVEGQPAVQIDLSQSFALSPYLLGSNVFP